MRLARIIALSVPLLCLTACPGPKDPCADVNCGNGYCVPSNGAPQCVCNTTYVARGLTCELATQAEICANDPCRGLNGKECQAVNGFPVCLCPSSTFETDAGCVPRGPCAPNPCTADAGFSANQTTCVDVAGLGQCRCNQGYAPLADGGCNTEKVYDCSGQHDGGINDDAYEPDECPTLARPYNLTTPAAEIHTIAPTGDSDWFKLSAVSGHILEVVVTNSSLSLWIDIYGSDGLTSVASDRRGVLNPSFRFIGTGEDPLYVRIRGYPSTASGSYTVAITDIGIDDFTNDPSQAQNITAGGNFSGNIQYSGDVDIAKSQVPSGRTYQYYLTSLATNLTMEAVQPGGATVRETMSTSSTALRTHLAHGGSGGREILLRAKAGLSTTTGAFDLGITDLGPDDHGDVTFDATPISSGVSNQSAGLERAGDLDLFSFSTQPGRIYRFSCARSTASTCGITLMNAQGQIIASSGWDQLAGKAQIAETWYAAVSYSTSTAGGAYTYQLEDLGTDDHSDTTTGATAIGLGTAATGTIEAANDKDVFSFSATATHLYQVSCTGTPSSVCSNLRVLNATGSVLAYGSATTPATFEATASGTLYAEVGSSNVSGTYSITVTDLGTDDYGDTQSVATPISVGPTANGSIETSGDNDYLSFTATAGKIYRVACTSTSTYGCYVTVRNGAGTSLYTLRASSGSSYGTATETSFVSSTTMTYYLQIRDWGGATGTYTITVTETSDDHPNTTTGAATLTLGNAASGVLQYTNDLDVFVFSATAGQIYKAACNTSAAGVCGIVFRDGAGAVMGNTGTGMNTTLYFTASTTAQHSVEIYGSSSSGGIGSYALTLTNEGTDDHANGSAGASALSSAAQSTGTLQYADDDDYFAITATQGTVYQVTCTTSVTGVCAMTVYSPSGSYVTSVSTGTSRTVSFRAATSGPYAIAVSGYAAGAYTLTVVEVQDDHSDTAPGTAVTFGVGVDAGIQFAGDVDVFSWTPALSKIYQVSCTGSSSSMCQMDVRDGTSSSVAYGYASTSNAIGYKALSAGTHSVLMSGSGSTSGTYRVTVTEVAADDHGDTTAAATPITVGAAATTANLDFNSDVDVFRFTATAMHVYQFRCTSSTTAAVCGLRIKNGGGTIVAQQTASSSRTLAATLETGGDYYVEVYGSGSTIGQYTYELQDLATDDYSSTTATLLTVGGAATGGNIELSSDADLFGFAATLGTTYQVRCTTSTSSVCSLTIRNPSGVAIPSSWSTHGPGLNVVYEFSATATGTYTIQVASTASPGSYQIAVSLDDGNASTSATTLTSGVEYFSYMAGSADADWYVVTLGAGSHTLNLPTADYYLYTTVYDQNLTVPEVLGRAMQYPGTTGRSFSGSGTFYIRVEYYSTSSIGPYSIKVQ